MMSHGEGIPSEQGYWNTMILPSKGLPLKVGAMTPQVSSRGILTVGNQSLETASADAVKKLLTRQTE